MKKVHLFVLAVVSLATTAAPLADTLVLRNGRRVQGELIGVFGREVEFEERNGQSRRTMRVGRDEIARIEFNDERGGSGRDDHDGSGPVDIPRGMRERRVNVSARDPWTDTGIDVRQGQQLYFSSDGEVRWGPSRRDKAEGERNSPSNPGRPLPDRPAAALIGRIGDRNDFFFIGGEPGPFRARSSGRLYLGINDDVFTDNSGAFRVTVAY